jgi:hypothetical protein
MAAPLGIGKRGKHVRLSGSRGGFVMLESFALMILPWRRVTINVYNCIWSRPVFGIKSGLIDDGISSIEDSHLPFSRLRKSSENPGQAICHFALLNSSKSLFC